MAHLGRAIIQITVSLVDKNELFGIRKGVNEKCLRLSTIKCCTTPSEFHFYLTSAYTWICAVKLIQKFHLFSYLYPWVEANLHRIITCLLKILNKQAKLIRNEMIIEWSNESFPNLIQYVFRSCDFQITIIIAWWNFQLYGFVDCSCWWEVKAHVHGEDCLTDFRRRCWATWATEVMEDRPTGLSLYSR